MIDFSRPDLDVGMVAHDTAAMLRFYTEVVGLPAAGEIRLPGMGVIHKFAVGTNLVKVFEPEEPLPAAAPTAYPWTRPGLQYWSIHVAGLDDIAARLDADGIPPITGVIDTGRGLRYMLVHDPDGNVIEFIEGD